MEGIETDRLLLKRSRDLMKILIIYLIVIHGVPRKLQPITAEIGNAALDCPGSYLYATFFYNLFNRVILDCFQTSRLGLVPPVDIFKTHNIILAKVGAGLNFDHFQRDAARVL